jgi:hypothetical protein
VFLRLSNPCSAAGRAREPIALWNPGTKAVPRTPAPAVLGSRVGSAQKKWD